MSEFVPFIEFRRELHRFPELSGEEAATANRVKERFAAFGADESFDRLGGHGLAFVFDGANPGPTVLLRCELDALPIEERNELPYVSRTPGVSHKCGHDGHMAILTVVGEKLSQARPERGRVVLLFQPAEETGQGAANVLSDKRFNYLTPDYAFALHNLPGFRLGQIVIREGAMCCASRGMVVRLAGTAAHAAHPEKGNSPMKALGQLFQALSTLPETVTQKSELVFVTVVGAQLGKKAFGTAPENAELWATLRASEDQSMEALVQFSEDAVKEIAESFGLQFEIEYEDVFTSTVNSSRCTAMVRKTAGTNDIELLEHPLRWSEDFGRIAAISGGALIGLGAGESAFPLHHPEYDFPDELISIGSRFLLRLLDRCLG